MTLVAAPVVGAPPLQPSGERPSTGGCAVYAVGDVHGRYDLLQALLASIAQDQASSAFATPPRLVFLGDYVDRGPDAARVLEALRWIKASGRVHVTMLMGNHEEAMLGFIRGDADGRSWMDWGGRETLAAYGVAAPAAGGSDEAMERARDALLQAMPASHLDLLMSLELASRAGDYLFVHAGVRPGVALEAQDPHDLLWIREPFIGSTEAFGAVVVHGHTWIDGHPQRLPNRIGVDTGACWTGVLTAVRLVGEEVGFLQVEGPALAAGSD